MNVVKRLDANELWNAMRGSGLPFALIDPTGHVFLDANQQYAALFCLKERRIKGVDVRTLYPPDIQKWIASIDEGFARGTLTLIRGQVSLGRSDGTTVRLAGWSRRIEGVSGRPLVVTSAVDMASGAEPPDDEEWVDRAPRVFGLPDDSRASSQTSEERAEELERHLWRIALELRTAGVIPDLSDKLPLGSIRRFGELPARQREIATRLVAGERVSHIAREMYLSPSTVRNHLTAVFRRFGVHSQVELIAELRGSTPPAI